MCRGGVLTSCSDDDDGGSSGPSFTTNYETVTQDLLSEAGNVVPATAASSDEAVATAEISSDNNGTNVIITSVAEGSATITVTASGYENATIPVTVANTGAITVGDITKFVAQNPENPPAQAVTLTGIEITTNPTTVAYVKGSEQPDFAGLVVSKVYSSGTKTALDATDYDISGWNSAVATESLTITVTVKDSATADDTEADDFKSTATFTVQITETADEAQNANEQAAQDAVTVESLNVVVSSTAAFDTESTIDNVKAALTVTPVMKNGNRGTALSASDYTISLLADDLTTAGTKSFTVTYTEKNVTSDTVTIVVSEKQAPADPDPNPDPDPETPDVTTVYTLEGTSAILNLGKTNIAAQDYLVTATDGLDYNSSDYTVDDITDKYPNFKNSGKTLTVNLKGVAAFDLYLRGSTGSTFYLTVNGTKWTVPNDNSGEHYETFNTGSTDEIALVFDGVDGKTNNYVEKLVVYNTPKVIPATVVISGKPDGALALSDGTSYAGLTATATPAWHNQGDIVWSSGTPAIAAINAATGALTLSAAGNTLITASVANANTETTTDSFTLNVVAASVAVSSVSVANKTEVASIEKGNTVTLTATVLPADATNKAVKWTSSNSAVATIDETTGELTTVGTGTVTITATSKADETKTDTVAITVTPIYVSKGTYSLIGPVDESGTSAPTETSPWIAVSTDTGRPTQKHFNIVTTTKIGADGFWLHRKIGTNGWAEFSLQTPMTVTIPYTIAASKKIGVIITTADGAFTAVEGSKVTIASGTSTSDNAVKGYLGVDGSSNVIDTNTKIAYHILDNSSGNTEASYTYSVILAAGTYKLYGATTAGSAKAASITFGTATVPNTDIATPDVSDITTDLAELTVAGNKVTSGAAGVWYVDGAKQGTEASTEFDLKNFTGVTDGKTYEVVVVVTKNGVTLSRSAYVTYWATAE